MAQEVLEDLNKRLTLALEASKFGVFEWNLVTNDLIWDKQMIELYGVEEKDFEGAYIAWEKGLHPDDKEHALQDVNRAIEVDGKFDSKFRIITPKGEVRYIKALGEVIQDQNHRPAKFIGMNWDITDSIKKNEALEEARNKAVSALEAKSTFLANMSHEIRTPLNGIIGLTSLLLDEKLDKEILLHIENIRDCGDSLLTLINDILDLSKIESGKLSFETIKIDLHELIKSTILPFLPKTAEKKIELETHFGPNVPEFVIGDPVRIRQILFNLIGNAVKFTHKGSVEVQINAKPLRDNSIQLTFQVHDTGIGIPNEHIKKLFCNFEQLDSSITRKFGGSGLGLSICKNLVEMMGGEIEVSSQFGSGSTFSFSIKVQKADADKKQVLPKIQQAKTNEQDQQELSLLVVEDNEVNQLVVSKLLKSLGHHQIDFAENGEVGVNKATSKHYDVIFMDVQMPVMNGYEATTVIKRRHPAPTIVGLSANAFEEDRKKAIDSGMDDYIEKPIKKENLARFFETYFQSLKKAG